MDNTEEKRKVWNAYRCTNNHYFLTKDIDQGTTPASFVCPTCQSLGFTERITMQTKDGATMQSPETPVMAWSMFYAIWQDADYIVDFVWRKPTANDPELLSAGQQEHVDRGGLLRYPAPVPRPDEKLKPSCTVLPKHIANVAPKGPGPTKFDQLIIMALGGFFDDYSFMHRVPEAWDWTEPKTTLDFFLNKFPELEQIKLWNREGLYDDRADDGDIEEMRREVPKELHKALGLDRASNIKQGKGEGDIQRFRDSRKKKK